MAWWAPTTIATRRLDDLPLDIRAVVKDQGGGHANHQFFWKILGAQAGGIDFWRSQPAR